MEKNTVIDIITFIRFLKDNNCYRQFVKIFRSEDGIIFRNNRHYNSPNSNDANLHQYLLKTYKYFFIFEAFPWREYFWSKMHVDWSSFLKQDERKK